MDQDEYYAISKKEKLPKRCPILNKCFRRAYTIYFYNYWPAGDDDNWFDILKKKGDIGENFEETAVKITGEACYFSKGNEFMYYKNMCPEVNLFDDHHRMFCVPPIASISGSWDKGVGFENQANRHFSECAEFCSWSYQNPTQKNSSKRVGISKKLRFEIFQRDKFTCQYCGKSKEDGAILHIDHRLPISRGGTDDIQNLITACKECNLGKSNKVIE